MLTKENLLYSAVVNYAVRSALEGDYVALERLGLGDPEVARLLETLSLEDVNKLGRLAVRSFNVQIEKDSFATVLHHIYKERAANHVRRQLMLEDAPHPMMEHFYGMTSNAYSAERKMLGLTIRNGRPPEPSEAEQHVVWKVCKEISPTFTSMTPMDYIEISRKTGVSLRGVWRLVQRWLVEHRHNNDEKSGSERGFTSKIELNLDGCAMRAPSFGHIARA